MSMCFEQNTCCCCKMPLWAGVLIIGLMEFFTAESCWWVGLHQMAGTFFWNSVWFALLFIPSLFYNGNYRKAVCIVYSVTTVFLILGTFIMTIVCLAMAKNLPRDYAKWFAIEADYRDGMMDGDFGPRGGDLNNQFNWSFVDYDQIEEDEAFEARFEAARRAALTDDEREKEDENKAKAEEREKEDAAKEAERRDALTPAEREWEDVQLEAARREFCKNKGALTRGGDSPLGGLAALAADLAPVFDCGDEEPDSYFQIDDEPEPAMTWLDDAVMRAIVGGWISVGVRIFFNIAVWKFVQEAAWLQNGGGGQDASASHPCRQTS